MFDSPMKLTDTLSRHIAVAYPAVLKTHDMFGFEIELEGKNIRAKSIAVCGNWKTIQDGSLRALDEESDALEYVLHVPKDLKETLESVKTLMDFLTGPNVEVYPSYRTSIHVHVNCMADEFRHVYNFITLAIIFDELFVSQNGDHRIGNNFCLRAKDAQGQIKSLTKSVEQGGNIFGLNSNQRYSSVNFVSLLKFGTVEFRSLECTTDYKRVEHWIKTLAALKSASRQFDDPRDIIQYFSRMTETEFLYFVLGAQAAKYAVVSGFETMLRAGMRLAQDFAYSASWKQWEPGQQEVAKPKPKLNKIKPFVGFDLEVADQAMAQLLQPAHNPQPIGLVNFWHDPQEGPQQ